MSFAADMERNRIHSTLFWRKSIKLITVDDISSTTHEENDSRTAEQLSCSERYLLLGSAHSENPLPTHDSWQHSKEQQVRHKTSVKVVRNVFFRSHSKTKRLRINSSVTTTGHLLQRAKCKCQYCSSTRFTWQWQSMAH